MKKFFDRFKEIGNKHSVEAQNLVDDAFYFSEKIITNLREEGAKSFKVKFGAAGYTTYFLTPGSVTSIPGFGMEKPPKIGRGLIEAINIVKLADGLLAMEENRDSHNPCMKKDILDFINDNNEPSTRLVHCVMSAIRYYRLADEEGFCSVEDFLDFYDSKQNFKFVGGVGDKTADELEQIFKKHNIRAWD